MTAINLTRQQQQIFAVNAPSDDIAVIGSFAAGQPIYSDNLAQLQSAAYLIGWSAAVYGGNNAPFMEEMNALFYLITYQIAYLIQKGVAQYSSADTYFKDSFCQTDGVIYRSLTDYNTGNAPASDDGTNWQECKFLEFATDAQAAAGTLENVAINPKQLATKQSLITSSNMLSADLVDDSNAAHKFATSAQLGQISTNTSDISGLQTQIDALAAASDVTDIVGTYAQLQAYNTSSLQNNDIVKVLQDETHSNETTYYRWVITNGVGAWSLIGEEGPYYTIAAADNTFVTKTTTVNGHELSSDITITASDITTGTFNTILMPDTGVTAGTYAKPSNLIVDSKGLIVGVSEGGEGAESVPINILATSGTVSLEDNSVNRITPSGTVIFNLPAVTDNTVFHQILVQVDMSNVNTIDLGTVYYFNKTAPDMSEAGFYNLIFEYASNMNSSAIYPGYWVVGVISKGAAS